MAACFPAVNFPAKCIHFGPNQLSIRMTYSRTGSRSRTEPMISARAFPMNSAESPLCVETNSAIAPNICRLRAFHHFTCAPHAYLWALQMAFVCSGCRLSGHYAHLGGYFQIGKPPGTQIITLLQVQAAQSRNVSQLAGSSVCSPSLLIRSRLKRRHQKQLHNRRTLSEIR